MKYRECDNCGAALDFGERCDCEAPLKVFFNDNGNKPVSNNFSVGNGGQRGKRAGKLGAREKRLNY